MVIVPSLTERYEGNKFVFHRSNIPKEVLITFHSLKFMLIVTLPVVGFVTPYMCKTVNTPSKVQAKTIPNYVGPDGRPPSLVEYQWWYYGGQDKAEA